MSILIIEDDAGLSMAYSKWLKLDGYNTLVASSGPRGVELARTTPDLELVIVDVMLPGIDGFEVCREIRLHSDVPILMITAIARSNENVVKGLELGADNYLEKPVDLKVLSARVRALLRRVQPVQQHNGFVDDFADGRLTINLQDRRVTVEGARHALTDVEGRLLALLVRNRGRVVSSMDICDLLWPGIDEDTARQSLYVYIRRLRRIIEASSSRPRYIVTERGVGYLFDA